MHANTYIDRTRPFLEQILEPQISFLGFSIVPISFLIQEKFMNDKINISFPFYKSIALIFYSFRVIKFVIKLEGLNLLITL